VSCCTRSRQPKASSSYQYEVPGRASGSKTRRSSARSSLIPWCAEGQGCHSGSHAHRHVPLPVHRYRPWVLVLLPALSHRRACRTRRGPAGPIGPRGPRLITAAFARLDLVTLTVPLTAAPPTPVTPSSATTTAVTEMMIGRRFFVLPSSLGSPDGGNPKTGAHRAFFPRPLPPPRSFGHETLQNLVPLLPARYLLFFKRVSAGSARSRGKSWSSSRLPGGGRCSREPGPAIAVRDLLCGGGNLHASRRGSRGISRRSAATGSGS
jgi:hypothetical protein